MQCWKFVILLGARCISCTTAGGQFHLTTMIARHATCSKNNWCVASYFLPFGPACYNYCFVFSTYCYVYVSMYLPLSNSVLTENAAPFCTGHAMVMCVFFGSLTSPVLICLVVLKNCRQCVLMNMCCECQPCHRMLLCRLCCLVPASMLVYGYCSWIVQN